MGEPRLKGSSKKEYKFNPKHNKAICRKCKYHTYMGNMGKGNKSFERMTDLEKSHIACYRSVMLSETCMKNVHGKLVDSRGDDYNKCNLFEPDDREHGSTNGTFGKWVM